MNKFLEVYDKKDFKIAKDNLASFLTEYPELYRTLFINGEEISYSGPLLEIFYSFGIAEKYKNQWRTQFLINKYKGSFFVTDSFLLPEIDRVFPISEDESLYLSTQINVNDSDRVLDIGTGSGIYAILSAKQAKHVLAIDINPKAISYAIFNSKLNNVDNKIEFVEMDIQKHNIYEKFSLIISNPAVIPAPKNSNLYIHSDGGIKGNNMSYKILNDMVRLLAPNGRLKMLCTSFSNHLKELDLINFVSGIYNDSPYQFNITDLYNPPLSDLSKLFNNYLSTDDLNDSTELYIQKNLNLHYLHLEAYHKNDFMIKLENSSNSFDINAYNGSWEARLNRLFLVYKKIKKSYEIEI